METQPATLPPLDAWEVEMFRITLFPATPFPEDGPDASLWKKVIGDEPERTMRKKGVRVFEGFPSGVAVRLTIDHEKMDWRFSLAIDLESPPGGLLVLGSYTAAWNRCKEYILQALHNSSAPVKRLAFGAELLQPTEDHDSGYRRLGEYLPAVQVSLESGDLLYRINRKRTARSVADKLVMNRLTTWTFIRMMQMSLGIGAGGTPVQRLVEGPSACRLELDINSDSDRVEPIPEHSLSAVWEELVELGREIAERGDVP